MSGEQIPVTEQEEQYFREMQAARKELDGTEGLGVAATETGEPGPADHLSRPAIGSDSPHRAGRGGVIFQPLAWKSPDVFLTLRRYINQCPDDTEVWVENGSLHFAYGEN